MYVHQYIEQEHQQYHRKLFKIMILNNFKFYGFFETRQKATQFLQKTYKLQKKNNCSNPNCSMLPPNYTLFSKKVGTLRKT